jgi:hypothetical protein
LNLRGVAGRWGKKSIKCARGVRTKIHFSNFFYPFACKYLAKTMPPKPHNFRIKRAFSLNYEREVLFLNAMKKMNQNLEVLIMSTESQILANRLNALKSTGPRTTEGKAAISQNAVKHGLLAERDVITSESLADFRLYRDQLLDELSPVSPMESILAERIVTLSWRLKRAGRFQNQAIDALNADQTSDPLKKLTQSLYFSIAGKSLSNAGNSNGELPLGRLAVKDFANARVLDRLLMYERRIENSLYKTLLEFQRLNLVKKLERSANPLGELNAGF